MRKLFKCIEVRSVGMELVVTPEATQIFPPVISGIGRD